MSRAVLAADIGGTNFRLAMVDETGRVLCRKRVPTPIVHDTAEFLETAVALGRQCIEESDSESFVEAFCLAVPAVLDIMNGRIVESPNLPFLNGLWISKEIEGRLGIPVFLENDATAAAIGENWLGASREFQSSVCITLGTGVGGGIILDGVPLRGVDGTAGEVGHICVEPFGYPCGCGSVGCLEQYASATGLKKLVRDLADDYPDSTVGRNEVSPQELYDLGMKGDQLALAAFNRMGFSLGLAAAGLINVLNPEVIVIGGGLSASWGLFIDKMKETIADRAFRRPAERAKLVRAELGDDAGILGAASLVFTGQNQAGFVRSNE